MKKRTPKEKLERAITNQPKIYSYTFILIQMIIIYVSGITLIGRTLFLLLFSYLIKREYVIKRIKNYKRRLSGYQGEAKAQELLSKFARANNFKLYSNIELRSKNAEMDFILLSGSSINIIEVKNMSGELLGESTSKYLNWRKAYKNGDVYEKQYYNPLRQVKTHAYKLSEYLKEQHIITWVKPRVLFTNDDLYLEIKDDNIYRSYEIDKLYEDILKGSKKEKYLPVELIHELLSTLGTEIK